ncbi:MAG: hypothetical protein JW720_10115 [Sedimentisphaerales bacterium]|nr:hypothetical protein [Sedimentisphaerales bacterium]
MKTQKYTPVTGWIMAIISLPYFAQTLLADPPPLGPEFAGLRLGLQIDTEYIDGTDFYDVRLRIHNTTATPITLVAAHNARQTYAEWLKAEVCFSTFPEVLPPSAQTAIRWQEAPDPTTTIQPGKEFSVAWKSYGRYLKTEDYHNNTPCFPSDGLYSIRAKITLHTDTQEQITLHSNEQAISLGGSVAMPKRAVAYVAHLDDENRRVLLTAGANHRIVEGDRFFILGRFPNGWMMTVTQVQPDLSYAAVELIGPDKEVSPLPPQSARAQLSDFKQIDPPQDFHAVRELATSKPMPIRTGMTRKDLRQLCHLDGGISPLTQQRYVLNDTPPGGPQGQVLKVKISFKPKNCPDEIFHDADKFRNWLTEHRAPHADTDVVMNVSEPYWQSPYFD